jgi:hypothetical protein
MGMSGWFVGGTYQHEYLPASAQRCVNWFPERIEPGNEKSAWILSPTPGLHLAHYLDVYTCTLPAGNVRGLFHHDGRVWAVGGNVLYEILIDYSLIVRGALATNANPVTFAANGDAGHQLAVTSGDKLYVLDTGTNVLTEVLASGASMVGFVDGYFLVLDMGTSTLRVSNLENALVFDPLDVGQRSVASDRLGSMLIGHREAWLFGGRTSEVWQHTGDTNVGAAGFAFYPPGGVIPHGTTSPWSACMVGGSIPMWLQANKDGGRMVVGVLSGYTPQRLSTHAIEGAFDGYSTAAIGGARAFSFQRKGHTFYVLSFAAENATWVYDVATGFWHELGTWNAGTMDYDAWRPQSHCFVWGKHLVGDGSSGNIYELDDAVYVDVDGAPLRRMRRSPYVTADRKRLFHDRLELICAAGVGNLVPPGDDPVAVWRWSNNAAKTWSNERQVRIGKLGDYDRAAVITCLGSAVSRIYELVCSDPVPWPIIDVNLVGRAGVS